MSRPTNLKPAEVSVRFALVFLRLEASVHRLRPTLSLLLLLFSYQVVSNSPWPHGLKHTRLPCPSPSPGVCSSSCPLSQWCHPTISSFVTFFSFCPQTFPASGAFSMSFLFTSDDQNTGATASASVLPVNRQGWFPVGLTGLISLQSKGLSRQSRWCHGITPS